MSVLPWLLLLAAMPTLALETRDARGLDVQLEAIGDAIEVQGVRFHIQRATGADVPRLAARVAERWRAAGTPMQQLTHGTWRMLSRWDGVHAELLQWRGEGASAELLHSRFNALRRTEPVGAAPMPQLRECRWGPQVRGMAGIHPYLQRTALCSADAASIRERLRLGGVAGGGRWREAGPHSLQSLEAGREALVTLLPGRMRGQSWLVWISHPASHEVRQ